jgi:hypothetical protein
MDGARQLVRYSLPGGLFSLLVIMFQIALHWAWGSFDGTLDVLLDHAVAVLAASIIFGFVIYQVYYAMYGPFIRLPPPFHRLHWARTHDRGGEIFSGLSPEDRERIAEALGSKSDLSPAPYFSCDKKAYKDAWYANSHATRSVLDHLAVRGGEEIKRNYVALSDIYHALGACRYAVILAFSATAGYVALADRAGRFTESPGKSAVAIVGCFVITWAMVVICHLNRADTWHTMTKQLRSDLRVWVAAYPDFPEGPIDPPPGTADPEPSPAI